MIEKQAMDVGIVETVRKNSHVKKGQIYVNHPWYNDDFGDDYTFDDVVEALTIYKSIYGDFKNGVLDDVEFVIPDPPINDDDDDDVDLSDFFSGSSEDMTKSASLAAQAIAGLDDLNNNDSNEREQMIQNEIERMQKEMSNVLQQQLPIDDANDTTTISKQSWPEYLSGMKLGLITRRIREGDLEVKHIPERKQKLDDIQFDWGDPKKILRCTI